MEIIWEHICITKKPSKDNLALTPSIHSNFDAHTPLKTYEQNHRENFKGKYGKKQTADKETERELKMS